MTEAPFRGTWRRAAAALVLLLVAACAPPAGDPARRAAGVVVDRPDGAAGPRPLIVLLHGAALSGAITRDLMPLSSLAREAGIAVAYPDAVGLLWNDASLARELPGALSGADDVAVLDALIDRLVAEGVADPSAIQLAGVSNGGMMAAH